MNLSDYAFLQNMIDCHDKANKTDADSIPWKDIQPLYTDVRNEIQSQLEMTAFNVNRPGVGQRYGMYVKQDKNAIGRDSLTNWMGQRFPYRVYYGKTWKRWGNYGSITYRTVYAKDENDEKWIGRWSTRDDLVIMRRIR